MNWKEIPADKTSVTWTVGLQHCLIWDSGDRAYDEWYSTGHLPQDLHEDITHYLILEKPS